MKACLFTLSVLALAVQGSKVEIDKRSQTYEMTCSITNYNKPIKPLLTVNLKESGGYQKLATAWAIDNQPRLCSEDGGYCVKLGQNRSCCNDVYLTINGITKQPS